VTYHLATASSLPAAGSTRGHGSQWSGSRAHERHAHLERRAAASHNRFGAVPVARPAQRTAMSDIELFYSYSHKDEALKDQLVSHLSNLRRQGIIREWHDRKIGLGTEWAKEIDEHLNSADVILLLVSADFIASEYCHEIEMKRAMERHESGEARVIPVILRSVVGVD